MTDARSRLEIYRVMVLSRAWEQALLRLIDENVAPASYHPGRGSEGSEVGATLALRDSDYLLYDHRGVAHIIAKGTPLVSLFGDFLANELGTTRGLGAGIVHVADPQRGVLGQSGTLGGSQLIAAGAALSAKLRHSEQVTMCFMGDGAANRGTFHEAANAAGAWRLPLVFVVQNNGWAISTPVAHSTGGTFADRGPGYGWHSVRLDGRNPFEVHDVAVEAVQRARSGGGPTLIEVATVRLTGHYLADPQRYRDETDRSAAAEHDPVPFARTWLRDQDGVAETELERIEADVEDQVAQAREKALQGAAPSADRLNECVYV